MEKLADGLQKLNEDDLLHVVQLVHEHKSAETYSKNDVESMYLPYLSLLQRQRTPSLSPIEFMPFPEFGSSFVRHEWEYEGEQGFWPVRLTISPLTSCSPEPAPPALSQNDTPPAGEAALPSLRGGAAPTGEQVYKEQTPASNTPAPKTPTPKTPTSKRTSTRTRRPPKRGPVPLADRTSTSARKRDRGGTSALNSRALPPDTPTHPREPSQGLRMSCPARVRTDSGADGAAESVGNGVGKGVEVVSWPGFCFPPLPASHPPTHSHALPSSPIPPSSANPLSYPSRALSPHLRSYCTFRPSHAQMV